MQRRQGAVGGAEQRHAVVLERLLAKITDRGHATDVGEIAEKPAEQIDGVRSLLGELAAGRACRIGAPLPLVTGTPANAIAAADRNGAPEIAALETRPRFQ